jgi:hypothetical protein
VKKKSIKVKPTSKRKLPDKIKTENHYDLPPFHISFPLTLDLVNDPEKRKCFFQCKEHLDTYLKRHNLKKKDYKVSKTSPKIDSKNEET